MGRLCWFVNGGCDQRIFFKVESRHTTEMNQPWHVFLQSGYKASGVYECRVTKLDESR
jgi:hypothetical protein